VTPYVLQLLRPHHRCSETCASRRTMLAAASICSLPTPCHQHT
jgi:hypothetical protein